MLTSPSSLVVVVSSTVGLPGLRLVSVQRMVITVYVVYTFESNHTSIGEEKLGPNPKSIGWGCRLLSFCPFSLSHLCPRRCAGGSNPLFQRFDFDTSNRRNNNNNSTVAQNTLHIVATQSTRLPRDCCTHICWPESVADWGSGSGTKMLGSLHMPSYGLVAAPLHAYGQRSLVQQMEQAVAAAETAHGSKWRGR